MNVQCLGCSSRYSVPDAKVQGRKVRIKCKKCSEPILIDGTHLGRAQVAPSDRPATAATTYPTQPPAGGTKRTVLGMPSALAQRAAVSARQPQPAPEREPAPRPAQRTLLGGLGAAPAPAGHAYRPAQRHLNEPEVNPEHDPFGEEPWTVAVTEEDQRELTTDQVVALYAAGTIDEGTYVWRDGMDDWCSPFEAPELKRALNAARIAPREPLDSDEDDDEQFDESDDLPLGSSPLVADLDPAQHGMWHEPGRLAGSRDQQPNFEDVTVSMDEKETQGLLRKARRADFGEEPPTVKRASPFAAAAAARERGRELEFDDEEVTLAISTSEARAPLALSRQESPAAPAFELSQRKGTGSGNQPAGLAPGGRPPPTAQHSQPSPTRTNEVSTAFSLQALTRSSGSTRPPPVRPGPSTRPMAPQPAPHPPLKPPPAMAAATAPVAPAATAPMAPLAPSRPAPAPSGPPPPASVPPQPPIPRASSNPPGSSPPQLAASAGLDDFEIPAFRRTRRWPWVAALGLALLGAGVAAYQTHQPIELWARVYALTGGQFPQWPELTSTSEPQSAPATAPSVAAEPPPKPTPRAPDADPAASPAGDESEAGGDEGPATSNVKPSKRTRAKAAEEDRPAQDPASEAEGEGEGEGNNAPDSEAAEETTDSDDNDDSQSKSDTDALPEFDRGAAAEALGTAAASASSCRSKDGPTGRGRATVTFANSGRATDADVTGAFAGTGVGGCIAKLFRQARVPAFSGPPVKVAKSFNVE